MMIFWDDAFDPPARPEPSRPAAGGSPPPPPEASSDPDPDPDEDQGASRIWHVPRFVVEDETGWRALQVFLAIALAWLIVLALYLR